MTKKDQINYLLLRIQDIYRIFGTVRNKSKIKAAYLANPQLQVPRITDSDIANFRRIVETGILKDQIFRPPTGYDVHSFLIALKDIQDRQLHAQIKSQDDEFALLISERIFSIFAQEGGDANAVSKRIREAFKSTGDYSKTLINKAYIIAKKKWERHVTQN